MAPYLDPECQAFIDASVKAGAKPLYELPFVEARTALEDLQKHTPASDVTAEVIDLPVGPSGNVKTVIFRPANARGDHQFALFTHGGVSTSILPSSFSTANQSCIRVGSLAGVLVQYRKYDIDLR